MKRTLFIVLAVVGFATAASAATLSVVSDKTTYLTGETITLTTTGDDQGATAYTAFGVLNYDGGLVDNGTRTQVQLVGSTKWSLNPLAQADDGAGGSQDYSYAFAQLAGTYSQTATNLPAVNPFSTVTLIAKVAGVVNVTWDDSGGPNQFAFFGLTTAPGTTFTIIPEPTTAVLFGLGLIGLVLGGRRRS
jgi:hypothetical protein